MPIVGAHNCNPSAQGVQAGGLEVQRHPQVHRKFEANLGKPEGYPESFLTKDYKKTDAH